MSWKISLNLPTKPFHRKNRKIKGRENQITYKWINTASCPGRGTYPIFFEESVHAEIKNLEEQDVIEDVTSEATPWLSRLVIVPKPSNKTRLCIDMYNAYTAIERTRLSYPNSRSNFSVEKRSVFYETTFICSFPLARIRWTKPLNTAFQTEDRIKRFERLIFGLNSASQQ